MSRSNSRTAGCFDLLHDHRDCEHCCGSQSRAPRANPSRAFTLIELILVMLLMLIGAAMVTPKLAGFFNGKKVESEARRIFALSRLAQSRAISEGIPVVLWVDVKAGTYGERQETGYVDSDPKEESYTADENLRLGVDTGDVRPLATAKGYGIHFSPDGTVATAISVKGISVQEANHPPIWAVQVH